MKLKIGQFARIGQVTVQTLRHYDDLGLLKPFEVDALSGYRHYSPDQLPRLHRILALKDLGFSLEQILPLLGEDLPPADLRGMLELKRAELRLKVDEGLDRLERLEARLRLMEEADHPLEYEVVIKPVEALRVASVRGPIASYWEEAPLWDELLRRIERAGLQPDGPYLSVYHSGEPLIDVEACAPIPAEAESAQIAGLTIHTLPAVERMACTVHRGAFTGLAGAFAALLRWIDAGGCRPAGPDRALYLRLPEEGRSRQDPQAVTEMQVPIFKG